MFVWFIVVAPVIVAQIFKSPKLDYRLVSLAAVFPVIGVISFIPNVFHSFFFATAVLIIVMLSTIGRRMLRRRLLAIPIGLFLHLILDFSWLSDESLWWPLFGPNLQNLGVPEFQNIPAKIALDVFGVAIGMWAWRFYKLNEPENFELFKETGNLTYAVCKR